MASRGRPTKLNPELQAEIVRLIVRGNYIETAAAAAGISKDTLYNWLKKGKRLRQEEQKHNIEYTDPDAIALMDFSDAIEKAVAEAEDRDVSVIDQAAQNGHWQAAAWRLERKKHKEWGRKLAVTDADGGSLAENAATAWAKALAVPVTEDGDDDE